MTEKTAAPLGQTDTNSDHTRVEEVIVECACNRDLTLEELRAMKFRALILARILFMSRSFRWPIWD